MPSDLPASLGKRNRILTRRAAKIEDPFPPKTADPLFKLIEHRVINGLPFTSTVLDCVFERNRIPAFFRAMKAGVGQLIIS
ncbi:MAG: hypothetical protein ACREU9_02650 [Gammaproteobacteria bacterium]